MKKLFVLLVALFPLFANAQDIVDRLDAALGVSLPSDYKSKVRNNKDMQGYFKFSGSREFIEEYIKEQMKTNWGISKGNQLIFVWSAIYKKLTGEDLYDGSDCNDERLDEFGDVVDNIEECSKNFKEKFSARMKQISAEARRQSAEYRQESIRLTNIGIDQLVEFYSLYKKNPSSARQDEIEQMKNSAKKIISGCKKYNIDYKSKLSPEMMKFYGIE